MSWKDYETLDATPEKATKEELEMIAKKHGLKVEDGDIVPCDYEGQDE